MRALVLGAGMLVAALGFAAPATAAAPCARDDGIIKLTAPERVAYEREAFVVVNGTDAWQSDGISNARLDMRDAATGEVFYSREFTAREMADMSDVTIVDPDRQSFVFYIVLDPGDGPAVVRLTYDRATAPDYEPGPCTTVIERTVTPFSGLRPTISAEGLFSGYHRDEAMVQIENKRPSCDVAPIQPVTVTVRGGGLKATFWHPDPCTDNFRRGWSRRGRVPGLAFGGERVSRNELRLYMRTVGRRNWDRWYRVTVKRGSRVVLRRYANAWVDVVRARRIWETDFDEYWNYCVRNGRDVRSSGGRLYCVKPGRTTRQVFIRRKPKL